MVDLIERAKCDTHRHELAVGALILKDREPDYDAIQPASFSLNRARGSVRRFRRTRLGVARG